jgi:nucleotide-binding universal stress UspA family protein
MSAAETADSGPRIQPGGRIVVGVDGSEASRSALQRGARIARRLDCTLTAVTAWEASVAFPGYYSGSVTPDADARSTLEQASEAVFGTTWPSWYHPVTREGWPPFVLVAESDGAEMLIVGSRGLGGFVGMLLGSTSQYCVEHAHCPTLVIPAAGRAGRVTNARPEDAQAATGASAAGAPGE